MNDTLQIPIEPPDRGRARAARRDRTWSQRLLRDSAYTLTALPIGILTFAMMVTGLSAGAGLVVVWVGLPVLVGTVLVARAFAQLERLRLRSLQGREAPAPSYLKAEPESSVLRRLLTPLRDLQSWLDTFWGIVGFVTGLIAFVVTVTWWSVAAGGLTYWFWQHWIPMDGDNTTLAELIGLGEGRTPEIWLNLGIGAFALVTLPLDGPRGRRPPRRYGERDAQRPGDAAGARLETHRLGDGADLAGGDLDHQPGRGRQVGAGPVHDADEVVLPGPQRGEAGVRRQLGQQRLGRCARDHAVGEAEGHELDRGLDVLDLDPGAGVLAGGVQHLAQHHPGRVDVAPGGLGHHELGLADPGGGHRAVHTCRGWR